MGLLGKLIGASASLIGAGAEALGNSVENVFTKREKKNLDYRSKYPYQNKFLIREVKEKPSDMKFVEEFGLKKNFFVVYSQNNVPIYLAYSEEKVGKCKYTLVDMAANEIAVLLSKKKSCSIQYGNNKYELKMSELFDKRRFSLSNSNYKLVCNDLGTEIKITGTGSKMQINKVHSDLGMKWGEYVIGCDNTTHSLLIILLGIAVGTILMQSANLLELD